MYYRQPRQPTPRDLRVVDIVARTVAIAIEQSRAEQALRESEERFRGTFENAAVGIVHVDASGRFVRVNEKFCAIVGYPRGELLQRTFHDVTHPDDLAAGIESFAALMQGKLASYALEKRYVRKDGSPVWVELFISLQRDTAGEPDYAIAILEDISERNQLDGELRQAIEAAEAASRAKDEFLANVSHEIRTPMNAILGMTELALDTPLTEDQRQNLKTVKSAADNLLGIINDLLDFAKIEAGKLELAPTDFSLRVAVGDTLRALAVRAHTKGLELVCHVQPDVPDALVGDAGRLRQVVLNLVSNAVKFTDQGEVVVRITQLEMVRGAEWRGVQGQPGFTTHHSPLTTHLPPVPPAFRGKRHRHRHPERQAEGYLPGLRAGGHVHHAQIRRHRPGTDHCRPAWSASWAGRSPWRVSRGVAVRSPSRRASGCSRTRRRRPPPRPRSCSATCRC